MIRVFLVDDHPILREGLRRLLATEAGLEVVGEAANGQQLLDQLPTVPADVVLLDLHMPGLDGLETTRRLHADFPQVKVLLLSMVELPQRIGQVLAAGARGYLLKNETKSTIVAAIEEVAAGRRVLSSEIGLALLDIVLGAELTPAAPADPAQPSRRELEVLQLVVEGLTTQQIADRTFTSKRTVETHRQNLLEKSGANNTATLVKYALQQGWLV